MRISETLFDSSYSAITLPLLVVVLIIVSPGLLLGMRMNAPVLLTLLATGLVTRHVEFAAPGAGFIQLSIIPSIAVLVGWRSAVAAAAIYTLLDMVHFVAPGEGISFILGGILIPTVAIISCRGFEGRLGQPGNPIAAGLGAWFAVLAAGVAAAFCIPLMGRALWGVFAPSISITAIWAGAIEGVFTGTVVAMMGGRNKHVPSDPSLPA